MKKLLTIAILMSSASASIGQTTVTKAMDFSAGTSIRMMNCNGIGAGPAGANQTWNFSSLAPIAGDTTTITFSVAQTGNPYGANLVERTDDTMIQYYNKTSTQMLQTAMVDSSSTGGKMTFTNSMLTMQRQLTYNLNVNDTFEHTLTMSGISATGEGMINLKVDGYGTLTLPNGTYSNVLRVRIERNQKDTVGAPIFTNFETNIITYLWFDNAHKAPLLRIDSTEAFGSVDVTAAYLLKESYPTIIADIEKGIEFTGCLSDRGFILRGDLKLNHQYEVAVYNVAGQHIFRMPFTAFSSYQHFDLNKDLQEGIYVVKLTEVLSRTTTVIKLAKQ